MTEFVRAVKSGNLKKVMYYIEEEYADIRFALGWAAEYGHYEIVKYLVSLSPPPVALPWQRGDDCIVDAAIYGHLEIAQYLVSLGANICQDYIIAKCAEKGHVHMLEYIVSLGGNILSNDNSIFWAAAHGQIKSLEYLASQGADLRVGNDLALVWAATNGHLNIILYLVSMGADVRTNEDGALRAAAENGHVHVMKYLLSCGADVRNLTEEIYRDMGLDTECFEAVWYLNSLGVHVKNYISVECQKYITFCENIQHKIRDRAQKKIYYWWIPICHNPNRESGKRMMQQSFEKSMAGELC